MGIDTIMRADQHRPHGLGRGEGPRDRAEGRRGRRSRDQVPRHVRCRRTRNIEVVIDENAARDTSPARQTPSAGRSPRLDAQVRRARPSSGSAAVVRKPILKLAHSDYIENSLGELLEARGAPYDQINIDVFNDLQHTIYRMAGRQAQRRRLDAPRPLDAIPQAGA